MTELKVCPSTLQEGFTTYSPDALKTLFDGRKVSHILDFDSPNNESADNSWPDRSIILIPPLTLYVFSAMARLHIFAADLM